MWNCVIPIGRQFASEDRANANVIVILYEANYGLRYIYIDGRSCPPQGSRSRSGTATRSGRWEGDTLVVETNNLRGAETGPSDGWLDVRGSPYSDQARFVERFRRADVRQAGNRHHGRGCEGLHSKPFTVRINQRISPDDELIEFVCNENQQFRQRIKLD